MKTACTLLSQHVPMSRLLLLAPVLLLASLLLPGSAAAQEVLWHWDGAMENSGYGSDVAGAGDVDADGFPDILVGAWAQGACYLYSGQTGLLIAAFTEEQPGDNLGAVSGLGDLDGDGFDEFLLGALHADYNGWDSGRVYLYSGQSRQVLLVLDGEIDESDFGVVSDAGDVDADGVPDFVVGASDFTWFSPYYLMGKVYVYSGQTHALLHSFLGEAEEDFFGISVACAGDVDGDGHSDILVGAPGNDTPGRNYGRVYIFSGKNGTVLRIFDGRYDGGALGYSVAGAGDVDADGVPDVILGAIGASGGAGDAYVYSGKTGSLIYQYTGTSWSQFGFSVAGVGDVNRDGVPDLLVGALHDKANGTGSGRAFLYSGGTGDLLHRFTGKDEREFLGISVAGAGDVNRDGFADLVIGAARHDEAGIEVGGAFVYAGNDLFLEANHKLSGGSQTLNLHTRGGRVGAPALLYLLEVNGTPLIGPLFVRCGRLNEKGAWHVNLDIPPVLWGSDATFQSFTHRPSTSGTPGPTWIDSSRVVVPFPP